MPEDTRVTRVTQTFVEVAVETPTLFTYVTQTFVEAEVTPWIQITQVIVEVEMRRVSKRAYSFWW